MRFSLTGDQADAALLVESIGRSEHHSLGACHIRGNLEGRLQSLFPTGSHRVSSAEEALVDSGVDAVIVAESNAEESARMARQASQADCHVVVVPPEDVSTAYSYELHLLLDESQRGVVVLSGGWYLPDDRFVDADVMDCQVGLPLVADDPDPAATLMHAVDACAALGLANSQVTVLGADAADTGSSQQIVLSGASADGMVAPGVTLNRSRSAKAFDLQGHVADQTIHRTLIIPGHTTDLPADCGRVLCERLAQQLPDDSACQARMEQFSRTLQVVEAVAKSIRRRRTVDVYGDELSERSVFKTQMTAMGCGVLTWMMFGMIGYLLIGQLFHPPATVMKVMRALWIAPVVVFLMAQFLLPLARGRQQAASQTKTDSIVEPDDQDAAPHSR